MPDYMFLLESRLSSEQRGVMTRVQEIAQALGVNVYLTGGAVRDLISGMPIRDLDFTVEGNPSRMAREFEKAGTRVVEEDERLRHIEVIFPGDADGSLAGARDEVYERPGAKPEYRWATVTDDLRRRDFSINAIGVSLNPASRGLLLDPTNGLADLEKREVRVLTLHSFTNQPIRLLRILRFAVRLSFKIEARTAEWFALAQERRLHESLDGGGVGQEVRQLAREEKPGAILKAWEEKGLVGAIHPRLAKRHPDYDGLARLMKVRDAMVAAGHRPRLFAPVTYHVLGRLSPRERSSALSRLEFSASDAQRVAHLEKEAEKIVRMLKGRKTATPRDAYSFLDKTPLDLVAFIQTESSHTKVLAKIRNFLYKWKPMRQALPAAELEALGVQPGPKFDKTLEDFFQLQLAGKGRNPQDRIRLLCQLAGIKPEAKKLKARPAEKEKPEKKKRGKAIAAESAPPAAPPAGVPAKGREAVPAPAKKPTPQPGRAVEPAAPTAPAKAVPRVPKPKPEAKAIPRRRAATPGARPAKPARRTKRR